MTDEDHAWRLGTKRTWDHGNPPTGRRRGVDGPGHPPDDRSERTTEEQPVAVGAPWTDPPPVPTDPMGVPSAQHLASGTRRVSPRPGLSRRVPILLRGRRSPSPPSQPSSSWQRSGWSSSARPPPTAPAPGPPPGELGAPTPLPDPAPTTTVVTPPSSGAPSESIGTAGTSATTLATEATTPTPPPEPGASTTAPPAPIGPLEACSTRQRAVIDRGNHPRDWYVARFDPDGDGIFCT
jgi:hypothetical protein